MNRKLLTAMRAAVILIEMDSEVLDSALIALTARIHELTRPVGSSCREAYETEGRVAAVVIYRNNTGCDLKTSMDEIDAMAKRENWVLPTK